MKKLVPILLLITIIVSCIFAFTACSKDGLYLLDEWSYTNDKTETFCIAILEFTAKSTLKLNSYNAIGGDALMTISLFNSYENSEYVYCKSDKIRFQVWYNINTKPEKAEVSINYKNGKSETLVYKF